jgi:hypothetical protein
MNTSPRTDPTPTARCDPCREGNRPRRSIRSKRPTASGLRDGFSRLSYLVYFKTRWGDQTVRSLRPSQAQTLTAINHWPEHRHSMRPFSFDQDELIYGAPLSMTMWYSVSMSPGP